ncbi:hypothetical protein LCGC14_0586250 [marine sediment metagenome]|uniref:Uncharacterized protein n=1 Tax=marine sediment metagenome TaxID=412755 RepID=A0A0F9RJT9_9ZZZZ
MKLTEDMIQPQSNTTMYPTIHIDLDTSEEWKKLTGDRSDKYDEMTKINARIMNQLKQQILDDHEIVERLKERIKKILSDKTTYDQYVCLNALQELQSILGEQK